MPDAVTPLPTHPLIPHSTSWHSGRCRLRGRCGIALVLADDGDAAVGACAVGAALRAAEVQHAVGGQRAANGGLVHVGGQAVAAVELA